MYSFEDAMKFNRKEVYDLSYRYMNPLRLENMELPYYVKGDGQYVWDDEGNRYLDMTGSIAVDSVGNCNAKVRSALKRLLDEQVPGIQAAALHPYAAAFAANLAEKSPGSLNHVWFGNSGTEAVEAVLKVVNLAHRHNHNKTRIVSCIGGFHGRTLGSMSLMGEKAWDIYNQKEIVNHAFIPFNDIEALRKELERKDVMAFFVEPIQGEAGIIIPDDDYLPKVAELCREHDVILVCDEIQSGFGRTGKLWAFENWDIVPDVCTFAKGYSAGYVPIAGFIATDELWNQSYGSEDTFFLHTNTFMEGSLACACALVSLNELYNNNWIEENAKKGDIIRKRLEGLKVKYPDLIKEIHAKGLLIAMVFEGHEDMVPEDIPGYAKGGYFTGKISDILLNKHHIIGRKAGVKPRIRFLPTYDITLDDIDYFIEKFDESLAEVRELISEG